MIDADFILKASTITNLADARYFASYGIKMLGFCFDPQSSDFMNPFKVKEISGWIEGPQLVGEFANISVAAINETVESQGLHYAQVKLHDITPQHAEINSVPLILEANITLADDLSQTDILLQKIFRADDYVLLNINSLTIQEVSRPEIDAFIKTICNRYPTLIDYTFSAENVSAIINQYKPVGICLHGSHEDKIGTKSFEALDALMGAIQEEF
jgi:phosphoribosylanthranilate isomerase